MKTKNIDRNFAPKGFYAVADKSECGCAGCAFRGEIHCDFNHPDHPCTAYDRPDGVSVIFRIEKCQNDTDGDGNCGKPACPVCGIQK